ncbi:hypothetical protein SAMN05421505_102334 [Sinosporangium album]|uniref:PASTA domain-containing protein n=1 Tax=Sinosporangium album TaxID=504805 RepID=A0A1G7SJP6_9ACTN|nr:hypothetical protein [Sinosporangium album]SDG23181.1 hypothetical protein SAMN05421505_102334 [Sinosporangium album]
MRTTFTNVAGLVLLSGCTAFGLAATGPVAGAAASTPAPIAPAPIKPARDTTAAPATGGPVPASAVSGGASGGSGASGSAPGAAGGASGAAASGAAAGGAQQGTAAPGKVGTAGKAAKSSRRSVIRDLPAQVGMELGNARSGLRRAGYTRIKTHDASGRGRLVFNERNWRVCAQNPTPGRVSREAVIDLAVVKTREVCPIGGDTPPIVTQPGVMPNVIGRSVRVARAALPRGTDMEIKDASGANRIPFRDTGWQVCSQSPAPGQSLTAAKITFNAVKYGEDCAGAGTVARTIATGSGITAKRPS